MVWSSDNDDRSKDKRPKRHKLSLITLVAVIFAAGVWLVLAMDHFDRQRQLAREAWDAGNNHPEATLLMRNHESTTTYVAKTLDTISDYWDTCSGEACAKQDIGHYPLVIKLGSLHFDTNGCFIIYPKVAVGNLRAASSRNGGQYKLTYNPEGTKATLCVVPLPQGPKDDDQMVAWSEDLAATR